jgi:hypothetical protein
MQLYFFLTGLDETGGSGPVLSIRRNASARRHFADREQRLTAVTTLAAHFRRPANQRVQLDPRSEHRPE